MTPSPAAGPFDWIVFRRVLAAVALGLALLWAVVPPLYLTNDDVTIRRGLEGTAFPGQPATGFVLLTHAALSWALVAAYRVLPGWPLWDLVLVITSGCALAILIAMAWAPDAGDRRTRAVALGALSIAIVPLLVGLQFTISSTLAGVAACALAASELMSEAPRRSVLLLAVLVLSLGMLVRPLAAAAGAGSVGLLLFGGVWFRPARRWRLVASLLGLIAAVGASYAAFATLDRAFYTAAPEWDAYRRYQSVSTLFEWAGSLRPEQVAEIRAEAGWSPNDWQLLERWWGVDPQIHGIDRVTRANEAYAGVTGVPWAGWAAGRVRETDGADFLRAARQSWPVLATVVAVVALFATVRTAVAAAVVVTLYLLLCVGIEAGFKELPFRLAAPLQAGLMTVVLLTVLPTPRRPRALGLVAVGVAAVATGAVLDDTLTAMAADNRHAEQVDREVRELVLQPFDLLVLHADSFPAEHWWRPFRQPPLSLNAISLGFNNHNPLLHAYLRQADREPLLRAVCTDESIVVVSEADRLQLVATYWREHYGADVSWHPVYQASFRAWRCRKAARVQS